MPGHRIAFIKNSYFSNKIDYLNAENGGLLFTLENTRESFFGGTLEECALIIAKHGVASCVMGSSSMDFASEYGFENDGDALTMYQYAIKLSGV